MSTALFPFETSPTTQIARRSASLAASDPSLARRMESLQASCDVLADGFDQLDSLVDRYLHETPLASYEDQTLDAERFLDWLDQRDDLTHEQRDYLTCQRSRHAIEFVAFRKRLAHLRFQQLLSQPADGTASLNGRTTVVLHLNPVHVWATYDTHVLLEPDAVVPATVLFFPVGDEIRTLTMSDEAADLVRRLEYAGPTPIRELIAWSTRKVREQRLAMIRLLADRGLVAVV
jgi:hypothetical protein